MQWSESAEEANRPETAAVGEGDRQRRQFMNAVRVIYTETVKLKSLIERKCKNEKELVQ